MNTGKRITAMVVTVMLAVSPVTPVFTAARGRMYFLAPPSSGQDDLVQSMPDEQQRIFESITSIRSDADRYGIEHSLLSIRLNDVKRKSENINKRLAKIIGKLVERRKKLDTLVEEIRRFNINEIQVLKKNEKILHKFWKAKIIPFYKTAQKLGVSLPDKLYSSDSLTEHIGRKVEDVIEDLDLLVNIIDYTKREINRLDSEVKTVCGSLKGGLVNSTDISWINYLLAEKIPEKFGKYLDVEKEDPWVAAMLFDAEGKFAKEKNIKIPEALRSKSPWKTFKPGERNDYVKQQFEKLAEKGINELTIKVYLRAIDGPGTSQDLIRFQVKLVIGEHTLTYVTELPATTFLSAEYSCIMRFQRTDFDGIIYQNVQRFKKEKNGEHARTSRELSDLRNLIIREGDNKGKVSYADLPQWVAAHYFGITSGLKIIGEPLSEMPSQGGMESSNAFSVAIFTAFSMLSGADWSYPKIHKQATVDENVVFPTITGGQGHGSAIVGGIATLRWISGMTMADAVRQGPYDDDRFVYDNETYGALVELPDIKDYTMINNQMYLVQPGKEFDRNGGAVIPRMAGDTNYEWTEEWDDPIGQKLHFAKVILHHLWRKAFENGDDEAAAWVINRQSKLRLALNERYAEWIKATTGKSIRHADYMDRFSSSLFEEVIDAGGGFMPVGAGGPGSVCLLFLPRVLKGRYKGKKHAVFFEANGLSEFNEQIAGSITQPAKPGDPDVRVLKGYLKFKPSDRTVEFSEGWKLISKEPAPPPVVFYNQKTAEVLGAEDFINKVLAEKLPKDVLDKLRKNVEPSSIDEAKKIVRALSKVRKDTMIYTTKLDAVASKKILRSYLEAL